jgi:hypothetical protein
MEAVGLDDLGEELDFFGAHLGMVSDFGGKIKSPPVGRGFV